MNPKSDDFCFLSHCEKGQNVGCGDEEHIDRERRSVRRTDLCRKRFLLRRCSGQALRLRSGQAYSGLSNDKTSFFENQLEYRMKVMIRRNAAGELSVYVPKKDLEEPIVSQEKPELWGGVVTLANGWELSLPAMAADTALPVTVEARRLSGD